MQRRQSQYYVVESILYCGLKQAHLGTVHTGRQNDSQIINYQHKSIPHNQNSTSDLN